MSNEVELKSIFTKSKKIESTAPLIALAAKFLLSDYAKVFRHLIHKFNSVALLVALKLISKRA